MNPVDVTMSLAKGAKMKGVKYYEGINVTGVTTSVDKNRIKRVTGVKLSDGQVISADYVVNCSGDNNIYNNN